jgi:enediyne biosynthesis protein E4
MLGWMGCAWGTAASEAGESASPILLREVTRETGINFVHTDGSSGRRYIVESVCAGLALFDYDGDGDVDIYFLNGAPLPGTEASNRRRGTPCIGMTATGSSRTSRDSGRGDTGYGLGVCVGDYDNDGHLDIYLNNFGPNVLYRNNGDGTFTDVTQAREWATATRSEPGPASWIWTATATWILYVGNYVDFTFDKHQTRLVNGHPAYVGPMIYGPVPDTFFRNNGDGTFTDVSVESGVAAHSGTGMGMVCADYDDDGDTDIVIGNDAMGNFVSAE